MALKEHQVKFILANWQTMTDREIADAIGCNRETVRHYRKKEGVIRLKARPKELDAEKSTPPPPPSPENKELFEKQLRGSVYYQTLREQLTDREMDYYVEAWGDLAKQFSDIIATERRQIDELIKTEIMRNRVGRHIKMAMDEVEVLAKQLDEIQKQPGFDSDDSLQEKYDAIEGFVNRLHSVHQAMANDLQRHVDLHRRILGDLQARRTDRAESIRKTGTTFTSLVEALRESEVRKVQGEHMEMLRLSREKKMAAWREPATFPDGSTDCILLDEKSNPPAKNKNLMVPDAPAGGDQEGGGDA